MCRRVVQTFPRGLAGSDRLLDRSKKDGRCGNITGNQAAVYPRQEVYTQLSPPHGFVAQYDLQVCGRTAGAGAVEVCVPDKKHAHHAEVEREIETISDRT